MLSIVVSLKDECRSVKKFICSVLQASSDQQSLDLIKLCKHEFLLLSNEIKKHSFNFFPLCSVEYFFLDFSLSYWVFLPFFFSFFSLIIAFLSSQLSLPPFLEQQLEQRPNLNQSDYLHARRPVSKVRRLILVTKKIGF